MKCISVLQVRSPSPRGPADFAAAPPPLCSSFFGNCPGSRPSGAPLQQCKPLPSCLSSHFTAAAAAAAALSASAGPSASGPRRKKRVLFADSQGLALTAVHVFHEDEVRAQLHFNLTEVEGAAAAAASGLQLGPSKYAWGSAPDLVLDFSTPCSDYLSLRRRLQTQQVCLESCRVEQRFLSGTVQVQNVCFQKQVWLRVSWDRWSSFRDVQCLYVDNAYGCADTFSFSVAVPPRPDPSDPVEFCVGFRADGQTFWDNNRGNNYRLVALNRSGHTSRDEEDEEAAPCDPCGSPRTSARSSARWHSWGRLESDAPYW